MAQPWIRTTVNVSPEFHKLCKEHHIQFGEAMRKGIAMLLADRGVMPYDNSLQLKQKLDSMIDEIQKLHNRRTEGVQSDGTSAPS